VDRTDGVTEETALTPTFKISKAGGAYNNRNSGTAVGHQENGWYQVHLDAVDTDTVGRIVIKAHDQATHLPVWADVMVIPQNAYDSLISGTGYLRVVSTYTPTVAFPVDYRNDIQIFKGDDYYSADGRALTWVINGGPSLAGATVVFKCGAVNITGSVDPQDEFTIYVEVPKTAFSAFAVGRYNYEVEATLSNTHIVTLITGATTLK